MEEQVRSHEFDREYETVCYIVSKCYLVNKNEKYTSKGNVETCFSVVCPYKRDMYDTWVRCVPTYNLLSGLCTNSFYVEEIFDTYEEAQQKKKDTYKAHMKIQNRKKFGPSKNSDQNSLRFLRFQKTMEQCFHHKQEKNNFQIEF